MATFSNFPEKVPFRNRRQSCRTRLPIHRAVQSNIQAMNHIVPRTTETAHSYDFDIAPSLFTNCEGKVLPLILAAAAYSGPDLTIGEPPTRSFGPAVYSEAVCTNREQPYCRKKDTRVGVSMSPIYIFDFGGELRIIYKTPSCTAGWFTSYNEIKSWVGLRSILNKVAQICHRDPRARAEDDVSNIADFYTATRYMRERAKVVFGPLHDRCWVKRTKNENFPVKTNCKSP